MLTPEDIDLERIAAAFKRWIHYEKATSSMFCFNDLYSMVLDIRASPQEKWQGFVHELAHVPKHAGNQFNMNRMFRELQEYQANSFMYHFWVPTFMLEKISLPRMQSEAIKLIGDTFNATYLFAVKRLEMYKRKQLSILWHQKLYQLN
ncbi:ImmA/IrrE family metallo-endopeptidase [Bacillus atrophaeus]|uniref:ImmA/IrrE family metallo-endopeptidase n=1 Tax=Bacillus atrophaeus TaxID=1452 RepID=UPI00240D8FC4|nr:ImmA/IrrE family metallo-endopeptidase [Bacillus atrophaeus]MED1016333.1 ImmA/IrrE family metallo-endopeptidase [Bacillus atrophaeus]MED1029032.1 ImmA/IrrE family metallo-endopeptidase [Bacillus atrophaeus]MED1118358.1 ImmA/IrrE family metallo-endopeptidase [Bacillus atrophaeus]MED1132042.1 ImmA/IrrE family metallo-endopeptidase [Bacillus atrophaeus]